MFKNVKKLDQLGPLRLKELHGGINGGMGNLDIKLYLQVTGKIPLHLLVWCQR